MLLDHALPSCSSFELYSTLSKPINSSAQTERDGYHKKTHQIIVLYHHGDRWIETKLSLRIPGGQNFEVCYFVPSLFSFFIFIVAINLNEAEKKSLQNLPLSKEPSVRYFLKVHDDSELGRHNVHVSKYTLHLKSSAAKLLLQWSMKRNTYN